MVLNAIFESAADGIITVDNNNNIQNINEAAAKIFGYQSNEPLNHSVERLIPEKNTNSLNVIIRTYQQTKDRRGVENNREIFGIQKNGEKIPLQLSVEKAKTSLGTLFIIIIRDITKEKSQAETVNWSEDEHFL